MVEQQVKEDGIAIAFEFMRELRETCAGNEPTQAHFSYVLLDWSQPKDFAGSLR